MLPVTHGAAYTKLQLLLYTVILIACTLLPVAAGMAGMIYLASVLVLNAYFLFLAIKLLIAYSDALAKKTFAYSIFYLAALFAALLIDHYAVLVLP